MSVKHTQEPIGDTIVCCCKCGREEKINFADCMRNGWKTCCGYTMTIISTTANIEKTVDKVIGKQMHQDWRMQEVEEKKKRRNK